MGTAAAVQVERHEANPQTCHRGRNVMVVCTGKHCQGHGAGELLKALREVSQEQAGDIRISASRCLGHCECAPAMVENGTVLRWVSLRRLRAELIRLGIGY